MLMMVVLGVDSDLPLAGLGSGLCLAPSGRLEKCRASEAKGSSNFPTTSRLEWVGDNACCTFSILYSSNNEGLVNVVRAPLNAPAGNAGNR